MKKWRENEIKFSEESKVFCKKSGKILLRFQRGAKIHPKYFNKKEMFSGGK